MIAYSIEVEGLKELRARLSNYKTLSDAEFMVAMQQSTITFASAARPLTPVFRGQLRNSIASEVIHESVGSVVGKVGSTLTSEEYPAVMEFGRAPGSMPPPSALERWVHLKMNPGKKNVKGVAFVVARSIGARGIPGKFFMKRAFEQTQNEIEGFFAAALERIALKLAGK